MPSSISACILRPPNLMDLFQSLLDALPQRASNSLGVYHSMPYLMHRPRPPDPNRCLCNSAEVFLQRTGRTGMLTVSAHERVLIAREVVVEVELSSCADACEVAGDGGFWITMWVVFISSDTGPPDMNPLSTHIIGLKWGSWSDVITLKVVPVIRVPTGRDTGTVTTPLESLERRAALMPLGNTARSVRSESCSAAPASGSASEASVMSGMTTLSEPLFSAIALFRPPRKTPWRWRSDRILKSHQSSTRMRMHAKWKWTSFSHRPPLLFYYRKTRNIRTRGY